MNNDGYGSDSSSDDMSFNLSSLFSSSNTLNQHYQQQPSTLPLVRQQHDDILEVLDDSSTINSSESFVSLHDAHPSSLESESVATSTHRSVLVTDVSLEFSPSPTTSSSSSSSQNSSTSTSIISSSSIFIEQDPHLSVKLSSLCSDSISSNPLSQSSTTNSSDIDDLSILTNRLQQSQSLIQEFRLLNNADPSPNNLIHRIQPSNSKSMKKLRQKHNRLRKQFQAEQNKVSSTNPYHEPTTAKINDIPSSTEQPQHPLQHQPDTITQQVDNFVDRPSYQSSYFKRLKQRKVDRPILKQWYGDKFTSDRHPQHLRIALNNGQGLTSHPEYSKVHQLAESMINFNVNAAFIPECKLNPFSSKMNDITTIYNSYHPFGTIHTTNTKKTNPSSNIKQHGGVTTCIDSALMTKFNGVEHDEFGRWQSINLLTKNYGLRMHNLYKIHGEHNKCTASAWHNIQTAHNIAGKPGSAEIVLVDDFVEHVKKDLDKNLFVVVCADANERVTDNYPRLHRKLTAIGMVNLLEHRMGSLLPPTQKDGHEAIDHIWVSSSLLPYIRNIGIAPLHDTTKAFHRS